MAYRFIDVFAFTKRTKALPLLEAG